MSSINLLEMNARYAVAISLLNKFRHWLQGREGAKFLDSDKDIFLESINMNQEDKLSPNVILYSFRGFGKNEHSAAIELSGAISQAINKTFNSDSQKAQTSIEKLKNILETKNFNSITEEEKEDVLKLVTGTMQVISDRTALKPDNSFSWKSL